MKRFAPGIGRTTSQKQTAALRARYARAGVLHVWLIDPELRTLETFTLEDRRWVLLNTDTEDDSINAPPFEPVAIELSALWA